MSHLRRNKAKGWFRSKATSSHISVTSHARWLKHPKSNAEAAEKFVKRVKQGDIPPPIKDLPKEALDELLDVVEVAVSIPSEVVNEAAATAAVTNII